MNVTTTTNVIATHATSDGYEVGASPSSPVGLHGVAPTVQRGGAAQAAVATTAPTNSSPYGYTQAQATAIITLLNEIRAALVAKGIIAGQ